MRSLFKLRYYARELTPLILVALLVMGVTAALNVGSFTNTQSVFEKAFERLASNNPAEQTAAMQELLRRALILLATITGAAISNCIALYMGDYIGQRILVKLREAIFTHLQTLSMAFFERKRAGELISRVNNDTVVLQRALGTDLFKIVVGPLTIIALIVQMIRMSWTLALALGVVIPLSWPSPRSWAATPAATPCAPRRRSPTSRRPPRRASQLCGSSKPLVSNPRFSSATGMKPGACSAPR